MTREDTGLLYVGDFFEGPLPLYASSVLCFICRMCMYPHMPGPVLYPLRIIKLGQPAFPAAFPQPRSRMCSTCTTRWLCLILPTFLFIATGLSFHFRSGLVL
jgi:hypothetical protein